MVLIPKNILPATGQKMCLCLRVIQSSCNTLHCVYIWACKYLRARIGIEILFCKVTALLQFSCSLRSIQLQFVERSEIVFLRYCLVSSLEQQCACISLNSNEMFSFRCSILRGKLLHSSL